MALFPAPPRAAATLDLAGLIRPDDLVLCGQVNAEPLTLTRELVRQRHAIGPVRVFLGAVFSETFRPEHADTMRFISYGAMGNAVPLAQAGLLSVVPSHYSELEGAFAQGRWQADVVLLQLAPCIDGGLPGLGLANDYVAAAALRARVVIAEWNPHVPRTCGAALPDGLRIDHLVHAELPPVALPVSACGDVERRIAARVAELVPDGATLQTGIGSLPDAVLSGLAGHRDLGLHSGMAGDRAIELIQSGVLTNARKSIDAGVSVVNVVSGTDMTNRHIHGNPAFEVRPAQYTHSAGVLAQQDRLFAINAALQVDLTGQVNTEVMGGTLRGGVGGLNDFVRGARASRGGRSVMVLQSTARGGKVSRIVPALDGGTVSVARSDADLVVTEWGVADLRHCTLDERARRLIAVAAPEFRDSLAEAWRRQASRQEI
ncbi:acetyl-CoA hydrolase/transferase family protein [Cupriavidus necator]